MPMLDPKHTCCSIWLAHIVFISSQHLFVLDNTKRFSSWCVWGFSLQVLVAGVYEFATIVHVRQHNNNRVCLTLSQLRVHQQFNFNMTTRTPTYQIHIGETQCLFSAASLLMSRLYAGKNFTLGIPQVPASHCTCLRLHANTCCQAM